MRILKDRGIEPATEERIEDAAVRAIKGNLRGNIGGRKQYRESVVKRTAAAMMPFVVRPLPCNVTFLSDCAEPLRRDSIDLIAASVDASLGIVEYPIFGEDFVNCRTPERRFVFAEDVVKIADQQDAVRDGCCFSLDRSTILQQRGSALADFFKCRFEPTKLLRAEFREHSLHLPGMLSKG